MTKQLELSERKPATTKEDILAAMVREHEHGATALSRKEIAGLVARKVTPRLIDLIEQLHADGKIARGVQIWTNGAQGYVYAARGGEE